MVVPRVWHDEDMTPHSEYKVVEAVIDAHQRPSQKRGVERPKRYSKPRSANKGSFSTAIQPGRSAAQRAIMEEDILPGCDAGVLSGQRGDLVLGLRPGDAVYPETRVQLG